MTDTYGPYSGRTSQDERKPGEVLLDPLAAAGVSGSTAAPAATAAGSTRTDDATGSTRVEDASPVETSTVGTTAVGTTTVGSTTPAADAPTDAPDNASAVDTAKDAVGAAKEQARGVAEAATSAGANVAGTAKEEAANVKAEAGRQAKDLLDQTRREVSSQLGDQQQKVAGGLRSLTSELGSMADSAEQPGVAADLARQAAGRLDSVATWLEGREPGQVLDEVRSFARERPGAFLAIAAGAGLLVGRLTRGLAADNGSTPAAGPSARHASSAAAGDEFFGDAFDDRAPFGTENTGELRVGGNGRRTEPGEL